MPHDLTTLQTLQALETRYWQAIKDKDAETAAAMSEDPCLVVGAQGVGELSRAALGKMLEGGAYELSNFALEDFRLRPLGEDVVAVWPTRSGRRWSWKARRSSWRPSMPASGSGATGSGPARCTPNRWRAIPSGDAEGAAPQRLSSRTPKPSRHTPATRRSHRLMRGLPRTRSPRRCASNTATRP